MPYAKGCNIMAAFKNQTAIFESENGAFTMA